MFVIVKRDPQKGFVKVKGGFRTSSSANNYVKKHFKGEDYKLWGDHSIRLGFTKYYVWRY